MANASYGNVLYCDTVGIISKTPVRIKAIEVDPSSVDGLVLFNYWDEGNFIATTSKMVNSVTTTSTTTFTDAGTGGVLTSAYADGAVLKIFPVGEGGGNGSADNHTYHLITTAGDNNVIVVASSLTNEETKSQKIIAYPARRAIGVATRHLDLCNEFRYFGEEGIWFPNLILETATNAVATIYLAGR